MDLTHFDKLKTLLTTAKDFGKVWHYFFDHLGEDPDFLDLGYPTNDRFLSAFLQEAGNQVFQKKVIIKDLKLILIPDQHFIHGAGWMENCLAGIIYFADIYTGIASISSPFGKSVGGRPLGESLFIRITGQPMSSGWSPDNN